MRTAATTLILALILASTAWGQEAAPTPPAAPARAASVGPPRVAPRTASGSPGRRSSPPHPPAPTTIEPHSESLPRAPPCPARRPAIPMRLEVRFEPSPVNTPRNHKEKNKCIYKLMVNKN